MATAALGSRGQRAPEQAPPVLAAPARRRRPAWLVGGSLLVVVCALGSAFWWSQTSGRTAVLAVAAPVAAGQVIEASDVRTVQVGADSSVSLVPASRRSTVVGRTAAVPLTAGSLLTESMLGAPDRPATGLAVAAVAVDAGRYPPALSAGATVTVVVVSATPDAGSPTGTATPASAGQRWPGVVLAVAAAGDGRGGSVVTLRMAAADATDLAAAGPVALIERHPGEN